MFISRDAPAQSSYDLERFRRENMFVFLSMNNICAAICLLDNIAARGNFQLRGKREKRKERGGYSLE